MVSAILLTISLLCACLLGSRFEPWCWGAGLFALGAALVAVAIEPPPAGERGRCRTWVVVWALPALGWFVWRACRSPVVDYARADLLFRAAMGGAFLWGLARGGDRRPLIGLLSGLALLVAVNAVVAVVQVSKPGFSLLYGLRAKGVPTGLMGHHNYFSNFMLGATILLVGVALCGRVHGALRSLWGICGVFGWMVIPLSNSRGGVIGMSAGVLLLMLLLLPVAKRQWRRGFQILVVTLPLALVGGGVLAFHLVGEAQKSRDRVGSAERLFGDDRLQYMRLAVDTIALHPWQGGGSQSYRWENRQVRNASAEDLYALNDLLFVHNEFLQILTDYGVIGGILAGLALLAVLVAGLSALVLGKPKDDARFGLREGILVGGLAGLGGMLVHGNFCILYHVLHGPLLLGLLAGLVLAQSGAGPAGAVGLRFSGVAGRWVLAVAGLGMLPFAWRGLAATAAILPVERMRSRDTPLPAEAEARALARALKAWPHAELHTWRGNILQAAATATGGHGPQRQAFEVEALREYQAAACRDPHEPATAVNAARLLSALGRWQEAEVEFGRAIRLQCGLEPSFGARHFHARHLYQQGWTLWKHRDRDGALAAFRQAQEELAFNPHRLPYGAAAAVAREMTSAIDAIIALADAEKLYRSAYDAWQDRQAPKALAGFLKARERLQAARRMPAVADDLDLLKLRAENENMIAFLEGAGIKPEQ